MVAVSAGDGTTCLLWDDCWIGQPLRLSFPELFSFAKKPKCFVNHATSVNDPANLFNLPLSVEAFDQLQIFCSILHDQHSVPIPLMFGSTFGVILDLAHTKLTSTSLEQPLLPYLPQSLEMFLSAQAKGFLLASPPGSAEHPQHYQKKEHVPSILQLHFVWGKY